MTLFDPQTLLTALGPWALGGLSLTVFVESGLLFPFLPGDSLLFVAGLFTGGDNPVFPLWQLLAVAVVFAVIGDQTGYQIGRWAGPPILRSRGDFSSSPPSSPTSPTTCASPVRRSSVPW